ncbi:hypothetical protein D3C71_1395160 [compost metagenome]
MVITEPPGPLRGETVSITGGGTTVNTGPVTFCLLIVIDNGPVLPSAGATTNSDVPLASFTNAALPLKST